MTSEARPSPPVRVPGTSVRRFITGALANGDAPRCGLEPLPDDWEPRTVAEITAPFGRSDGILQRAGTAFPDGIPVDRGDYDDYCATLDNYDLVNRFLDAERDDDDFTGPHCIPGSSDAGRTGAVEPSRSLRRGRLDWLGWARLSRLTGNLGGQLVGKRWHG